MSRNKTVFANYNKLLELTFFFFLKAKRSDLLLEVFLSVIAARFFNFFRKIGGSYNKFHQRQLMVTLNFLLIFFNYFRFFCFFFDRWQGGSVSKYVSEIELRAEKKKVFANYNNSWNFTFFESKEIGLPLRSFF